MIGPVTAANRLAKREASNGGHAILSLSSYHVRLPHHQDSLAQIRSIVQLFPVRGLG